MSTGETMDVHEQEMVNFVKRWRYYEDGDEHIFPEFGIPAPQFYARVIGLLGRGRTAGLDVAEANVLRTFCLRRLLRYRS